jgi:CBS domain-containing protein
MSKDHPKKERDSLRRLEISDADIFEAMKDIPGYLDITPGDFKEVYQLAYRHARERLSGSVKARDVMTRDVALAHPETPLQQVAEVMARKGVSGVPVVDGAGKVLGVISEKDFIRRMGAKANIQSFMGLVAECLIEKRCQALPMRGLTAAELMSEPPVTVGEETPIVEIGRIFKEKSINRVPVTDSQGLLKGIVSRADLLNPGVK